MTYPSVERFKEITDRNVLSLQELKLSGTKVVGQYCIYSPLEIALAAGAVPVSLCGTKNDSIPAAESMLPRSLCPLIKSSFGFALEDSCPYLAASDIVIADTTCDGKKKMFELLAERKPVFILQLPQIQNEPARQYWKGQYERLIRELEQRFNVVIGESELQKAIHKANRFRRALKSVLDLAKRNPSPLSGMQLMEIAHRASFVPDWNRAAKLLEDIAQEVGACGETPHREGLPRLLLTGVPVGLGSHKVVQLLEVCGASVVCLDNCSCYKKVRLMIDESADPLEALASRYLDIPCAVMSPNPNRYKALEELAQEFQVDAVVDLTWQGCQTYDVESWSVKKFVREQLHLPFLQIVTDYSPADTEQLKVRMEAFLEMLR